MRPEEISLTFYENKAKKVKKDFQVVVNDLCVTESFPSAEDAYENYICQLANALERVHVAVNTVSLW